MIRPGALLMSVLMAAVAVGTYYGLGYVPPGIVPGVGAKPAKQQEDVRGGETQVADVGTAVTQGTVESLAPAEPAAAETPAASETPAAAEAVAEAPVATSPTPTGTGASNYASSEEVERALADEPPPEEDVVKPQAAAPTPAPKPQAAPPKASAPAKAAAAPAPQTAPSTGESSESASKPATAQSADADVIKPWWPDPAKMPENQLKLMYAGQVKGELAIALLFSAPVELDSLKQNTQVKTAAGSPVSSGQWELGKNPKLAIFRGVEPGRYTVVLSPTITGAKGFMLGTALQGPVYVKAP